MIRFACPTCGKMLRVPDELAGQAALCPKCNAVVNVPKGAANEVSGPGQPLTSCAAPSRDEEHDEPEVALSKPSQKIDQEELIDMTAMVDIVFFLLIFFLVTSMSGLNSSMNMPNPEARSEEGGPGPKTVDETEAEGDFITVQINRDDSLEIDGIQVPDIPALLIRLQQLHSGAGARSGLLVIGNGNATHGTAVAVLDAAYEAGMEKVRLAIATDKAE